MNRQPVVVADTLCRTGEGPIWHELERKVYWVDIPAGTLYRYDPATGTYEIVLESDEAIGGYTFQSDGGILLFQEHGAVRLWREGKTTTVIDQIAREVGGRFNDVIADPEGRVYCGTMPIGTQPGRLYRLDPDGTLHIAFDDAGLSNGLGFSPDLQFIYHSDSRNRVITKSRYDRATGELTDRAVFHRTQEGDGVPDGMTVDADGHVWVAQWDGHALIRLDHDGSEMERVRLTPRKVSSLTFGGDQFRTAWVTTANVEGRDKEGDGAGALFEVELGVSGRPEFFSNVKVL